MPKMSKEDEDIIIELIDQGYKDAEISRKTGKHRTTIADRRKEWEKGKQAQGKPETEAEKPVQQEHTDSHPLDPQLYTLIRYQGTNSREEALSQAIKTQNAFNPYLLNHGFETPKELIKFFEDEIQLERMKVEDLTIDSKISHSLSVTYQENIVELGAEKEREYDEGYQDGKNDFALPIPCTSCGMPITLTPGTETHRHIVEFCRKIGIIHNDCIPKYERIYA